MKNKKGFTIMEIMVVVFIITALAAIAVPNLLNARKNANETNAKSLLKTIATACENYANDHNGDYPAVMTDLTSPTPPYLNVDYLGDSQGYTFAWPTQGVVTTYTFTAVPVSGATGSRSFSVCEGAVFTEAEGSTAPDCP